jgi:hypothetical protein
LALGRAGAAVSIIAIDPGVHRCACAGFDDAGRLVETWYETARTFKRGEAPPPSRGPRRVPLLQLAIVVEQPQYDGRSRTARAQDLMGLCWHGALLAGEFAGRDGAPVVAVTPTEWKGTEPKPRHHARLWEELDEAERRVLGGDATGKMILAARTKGALSRWSRPGASYYPRGAAHDLLDAAALGAWYLGRLEKR